MINDIVIFIFDKSPMKTRDQRLVSSIVPSTTSC